MLRGECMPAFLVCCPPQAGCLQDGPGCATPAAGDPCRTRTCVRCVRGSRPTAGRTGRRFQCVVHCLAGPIRTDDPAFGGQRSSPLSYGELAPEARLKLTFEASRAPVSSTTPPGSDNSAGALQSDAYGARTRTSRIDGPALVPSSSRARWDIASLTRAGRIRAGDLGLLGYQLPAETQRAGTRPARASDGAERRTPRRAEGGSGTDEIWCRRRSAGLPPGCGRRGSNSHGRGPLASEASASTGSATSAWRGLRPGAVPRRRPAEMVRRTVPRWRAWRPSIRLLAISSIVKVHVRARRD